MKALIVIVLLSLAACGLKEEEKMVVPPVNPDTVEAERPQILKPDTSMSGERISGPLNVRDSVNGKVLFRLYDSVAVTSTAPRDQWMQVGVIVDLTKNQLDDYQIPAGSKLISNGIEIGEALQNIPLHGTAQNDRRFQAEITGYAPSSALIKNTIPENILSEMVNSSAKPLTIKDLQPFIRNYQFSRRDDVLNELQVYEIYENWIEDPSALLRIWLLFDGDELYGVIHSRAMRLERSRSYKLERGFYLSTFIDDKNQTDKLIREFNSFIGSVD